MSSAEDTPPGLPTTVEAEGTSAYPISYSESVAERILRPYREGLSLGAIAKLDEMPSYNTILRWVQDLPEFREKFNAAKVARALHLENEAITTVHEVYEGASEKELVGAGRLKFEGLKWGAEVNDPATYGKKVTHGGDATRPIIFQVSTGFPEPNEFQRPPKLGADGLIERAKEVTIIQESEDNDEPDPPRAA